MNKSYQSEEEQIELSDSEIWRDEIPVMIFSVDQEGFVREASSELLSRTGFSRNEVVGRRVEDLLRGYAITNSTEKLSAKTHPSESCSIVSHVLVTKSGEEIDVDTAVKSSRRNNSYREHIVIQDVSDYKKSADHLRRVNQALRDFASMATHDIRAPLRHMMFFAELLREEVDDGSHAAEIAANIQEAGDRMSKLIHGILMFSRSGYCDLQLEKVDLGAIVRSAMDNLSCEIRETSATVSFENPISVRADPNLLTCVFQNLIENSLKHRSKNRPEIIVNASQVKNMWLIRIEDNGSGVNPNQIDRVFEAFSCLPSGSHSPESFGLGLPLCRQIIQSHGGEIWFDCDEIADSQGATICMTLPI